MDNNISITEKPANPGLFFSNQSQNSYYLYPRKTPTQAWQVLTVLRLTSALAASPPSAMQPATLLKAGGLGVWESGSLGVWGSGDFAFAWPQWMWAPALMSAQLHELILSNSLPEHKTLRTTAATPTTGTTTTSLPPCLTVGSQATNTCRSLASST